MRYDITIFSEENDEGARVIINTFKSEDKVIIKSSVNDFGTTVSIAELEKMLKKIKDFLKIRSSETDESSDIMEIT